MAHAKLTPREKPGRGKKSSGKPDDISKSHWKNLVSQARIVIEYAPKLVDKVREGFRRFPHVGKTPRRANKVSGKSERLGGPVFVT